MASLADRWVAESGEVLYPRPGTREVTAGDIAALKAQAERSPRGRCRICLHGRPADQLHDMVIAFAAGAYDRPHRHHAKTETLIAMEGEAFYVCYSEDGRPVSSAQLSASSKGDALRVLRTPTGVYHGLLITRGPFVFCESTLGPFDPKSSEFAAWSPPPDDKQGVERYLAGLSNWAKTV